MEQIIWLDPFKIRVSEHNQRQKLDEKHVVNLMLSLQNGGELLPIQVRKEHDGSYSCYDGQHRLTAYQRLGRRKIPTMVKILTDNEVIVNSYISGCNKIWTVAETANTCLNLYQRGESAERISNSLNLTRNETNDYIKLAYYLHPDILNKVVKGGKKGLGVTGAIQLCRIAKQDQQRALKDISKIAGSKCDNIKNLAATGNYQTVTVDIKHIKQIITPNRAPVIVIDQKAKYIDELINIINGYCKKYKIDRVSVAESILRGN